MNDTPYVIIITILTEICVWSNGLPYSAWGVEVKARTGGKGMRERESFIWSSRFQSWSLINTCSISVSISVRMCVEEHLVDKSGQTFPFSEYKVVSQEAKWNPSSYYRDVLANFHPPFTFLERKCETIGTWILKSLSLSFFSVSYVEMTWIYIYILYIGMIYYTERRKE